MIDDKGNLIKVVNYNRHFKLKICILQKNNLPLSREDCDADEFRLILRNANLIRAQRSIKQLPLMQQPRTAT